MYVVVAVYIKFVRLHGTVEVGYKRVSVELSVASEDSHWKRFVAGKGVWHRMLVSGWCMSSLKDAKFVPDCMGILNTTSSVTSGTPGGPATTTAMPRGETNCDEKEAWVDA